MAEHVGLDPAPFFQRTDSHSDRTILENVDIGTVSDLLTLLGYPLQGQGPETVLDAVQCFQDSWGLDGRLQVDRWPGDATVAALNLSVGHGGLMWNNFSARELSDKRTGWIWTRYELGQGLQAMRDLIGGPMGIVNTYRRQSSNIAAGSTSFPDPVDPVNGKPGSRHIWAEAADVYSSFGITVGAVKSLRFASGIGANQYSASTVDAKTATHVDIGGTLSNDRGSNSYARTGGVDDPMLWFYNR